ncbi:MAG: hypothetical protein methR_P0268 [Methyloprofundus sp.]|nr:MAG: hypothetical protein methR_P0268 [Methyloprofundus sp.]
MNLKQYLPLFGKASEILVCETDGFSLRGAVIALVDKQLKVLHQATISQVDMAQALPDLLTALQNSGWQGGGSAVLLSPAVLSTLVELPVNPQKPRPLQQMMALVQGEVDVLLMQHMTRWSVGHLLVGRGYLTAEQAQAVMDLQQGRPNPAGGLELQDKYSFRRFGDLAVELGYIKASQLAACLTGQEWLKAEDDLIECNWIHQGAVDDVPGTFNWLVSCISQSLFQRWVAAFTKQGLNLTAMYPYAGCSTSLLPEMNAANIVLESRMGLALTVRTETGQITQQQADFNVAKPALALCLEAYHALQANTREPVWVACEQENAATLISELQQALGIEVHLLTHAAVTELVSLGMLGVANCVLNSAGKHFCLGVREGGPPPPPMQRLEVRATMLAACLLLALVGTELSLYLRHAQAEAELHDLKGKWSSLDTASKRIQAEIKAIKLRTQDLEKQHAEQARLKAMLNFYNVAIPERVALIQNILGTLQSTVSNEVIIISLDEGGKKQLPARSPLSVFSELNKSQEIESFMIDAWALTEATAQTFIQNMQRAVAPYQLKVNDTPVLSAKGPLNLDGFSVKMRLIKLQATEQGQAIL